MDNNVIIISFSSRIDGNCEHISDLIRTHLDNRTGVRYFKFSDFLIYPCGRCRYQCFQDNTACPYIGDMEYKLLDEICHSTMAFFVIPNYCDYPCANFYIFNERSQCYFQNHPERLDQYLRVRKKFIVVSNSKAESFVLAFEQHTDQKPQIIFMSARNYGCNSTTDDIMNVDAAKTELKSFIQSEWS